MIRVEGEQGHPQKWSWMSAQDLEKAWAEDAHKMKADLASRATVSRSVALCGFLPSEGVGAFQYQR